MRRSFYNIVASAFLLVNTNEKRLMGEAQDDILPAPLVPYENLPSKSHGLPLRTQEIEVNRIELCRSSVAPEQRCNFGGSRYPSRRDYLLEPQLVNFCLDLSDRNGFARDALLIDWKSFRVRMGAIHV
jgi:hypothetical protein